MAFPFLAKAISLLAGFLDLEDTAPGVPASGRVRLFRRNYATRQMPAWIGATGLDTTVQPFLATNKIGLWCPAGNSTAVPGVLGLGALTALGTATNRGVTAGTLFQRARRQGYVGAATAAAFSGLRSSAQQITTGTGSGLGGFHIVMRLAITDAVLVAAARMFAGISSTSSAPTNVEPSTLINVVGIGHGAADTNLSLYYGGSTAQTPIDLGANFPVALDTMYELQLFSSPGVANVINWLVTNFNTGNSASGTISGGAAVLPQSSQLLTPMQIWRCNNATLAATALDIVNFYFETDN